MAKRLLDFFRRIWGDLLAGRSVDAYVIALIAIALVVLDVIGDVPLEVQLTVMVAALAALVLRAATEDRQARQLEAVQQTLDAHTVRLDDLATLVVAQPADLNDVLRDRNRYGPWREFLRGGQVLWVCAPSAINILRDPSPIKEEILDRGGEVWFLLQDPSETRVVEHLQAQLDIASLELTDDIRRSVRIMDTLKSKGNIQYHYLPYMPGFSLTIVDPERANGRLVVEFFGFQNEFIQKRMHVQITRQESEYWFEYWVNQFRLMQRTALEREQASAPPAATSDGTDPTNT